VLWAEADRMRAPVFDQAGVDNQRDVVKNEVRVNVKNQPYGSFPWIDLPMAANTNWANAHDFYGEYGAKQSGLAFPGEEEPDYWDFVYFSLVIGMTAQVADVGITTKEIRRTVAAHGVVSFLFNVALLALMVNIAASAM
jgi:uncharacterized membrane protein